MSYKSGSFKQACQAEGMVSQDALGGFEELELDFAPQEAGYLMVYVANQTNENISVFFDQMRVEHTSGPIVRVDDYYTFGMTFNTDVLTGALTNKYLYNGKLEHSGNPAIAGELQNELGLDWHDYGARMYDAAVGRFFTQDRFAEKYNDISPYQYVANNPIRFIDVNGDSIWVNLGQDKAYYYNGALYNKDGSQYEGDSKFAKVVLDNLKKMSGTEIGNKVLSALIKSETILYLLMKNQLQEKEVHLFLQLRLAVEL